MLEALLANLDTILLVVFGVSALVGGVLVIVLRQPMRVAMALISTMVFLGGIYGLLGVHFIAAFQVLIYVGAVMVFMVYVIMLLDTRDPAQSRRFSALAIPGAAAFVVLLGGLVWGIVRDLPEAPAAAKPGGSFGVNEFAVAFLNEYWLHFELTSVLLLAAVVAAVAVIKASRGDHG
jgi:NADH-quinone oxidoreductase subunit J